MSIIEIAKNNPTFLADKTIQQIVAMCGDGRLRDSSACSIELREYLASKDVRQIANYAQYCLENKFEKSGEVLQDCVNEMGRRLSYQVKNGRYTGVKNDIGFDGLWFDETHHLLVEVKTTDAYRINLDTITDYGERIRSQSQIDPRSISTLIVVGRQDTGDLEAQVRGSRHAWTVRIISVDALAKLVFVNDQFKSKQMLEKIRRILLPFEYTRVDNIVELVFEAQQEAEVKQSVEEDADVEDIETEQTTSSSRTADVTPSEIIHVKRKAIVASFFGSRGKSYTQQTTTFFTANDGSCNIVCAISKRYLRDYQPYWYALHPDWLEKIRKAKDGFFILGCADSNVAYALPLHFLDKNLNNLNMTEKDGGKSYWHIALNSDGGVIKLNLSKIGMKLDLTSYKIEY